MKRKEARERLACGAWVVVAIVGFVVGPALAMGLLSVASGHDFWYMSDIVFSGRATK